MLPDGIPTVTVTGRFLTPQGEALAGRIVFRAPALVTLPDHDVILGGPVTEDLDATGAFSVTLLATDAPGMDPSGWSYSVAEQLTGVAQNRVYQILLPSDVPTVDLADIAPTDPTTPTYVAVRGDSAYEVAVEQGFVGTITEWLASLVGETGAQGVQGEQGIQGVPGVQGDPGVQGAPGVVQSVNGQSAAAVVLTAAHVEAVPLVGTATGVASVIRGNGTSDPLTVYGNGSSSNRFLIRADGSIYSNSLLNSLYNVGIGTGAAPFGGGTYVLGMQNAATAPSGTPANGVVAYSDAGKLKILQGDGTTVTVANAPATPPAPGTWLPSDYGLSGWAYDLHPNSPTPGDMPSQAGRLYFVGVPLRTAKTVTQIAVHVMGYDKPNTTLTGAYFGLYDSAFAPLSRSGDVRSQLPEVHNVGGQIAKITIPSVSLAAGFYYVAILVKGPTTASPYFAAANWSPASATTQGTTSGAVGASTSGVHRWLQSSSTAFTTLTGTGTLTAASWAETTTCYWAAIV